MHPLFTKVKNLVAVERKLNVAVLECLKDISVSKLYLDWGYSSLFAFATEGLGYSEGAAYRRVKAVELLRSDQGIAAKLESGELTLTSAAQVQNTIKQLKQVSPELRLELINAASSKSTRESEKALAVIAEKYGAVPQSKTVSIEISPEAAEILLKLRALHSHKNLSDSEIIIMLGKKALAPKETVAPAATSAQNESTRYIPAKTRRFIFQRDLGRCTFTSANHRCNSQHFLQIDHKIPLALGGTSRPENLRLLCGAVEKVLVHGRI